MRCWHPTIRRRPLFWYHVLRQQGMCVCIMRVHLVKFDAAISPQQQQRGGKGFSCPVQNYFERAIVLPSLSRARQVSILISLVIASSVADDIYKTLFDAVRPEEAAFLIFFCRDLSRYRSFKSSGDAKCCWRVANQRRNCTLVRIYFISYCDSFYFKIQDNLIKIYGSLKYMYK